MKRRLLWAFLLVIAARVKASSDSPASFEEDLKVAKASAGDEAVIEKFTKLATAGNIDALMSALDPAARELTGDAATRAWLQKEIIPFFANVKATDSYRTIARAALPDGRVGRIHYTYVATKTSSLVPVSIALVESGGKLGVVYVDVGHCVAGRHPISKGRCE